MNRSNFRWIEEAPAAQSIRRDEVAPFLIAPRQIESRVRAPETAVRRVNAPSRFAYPQARSRGHLDHQARLVPKLRRWRAGNHFQRLNRSGRNLVRENLAGLVRDRLAVHRE